MGEGSLTEMAALGKEEKQKEGGNMGTGLPKRGDKGGTL